MCYVTAEVDDTAHPIGSSVYDVTARSSAIVLEETRLTCREWKKKGLHWLRMKLKFLLNLARFSGYCGTHQIPVTRTEIKDGNALLLITEAFGWHGGWTGSVHI